MAKPKWLLHLGLDSEAWQSFTQWIAERKAAARNDEHEAIGRRDFDAATAHHATYESFVTLEHETTRHDREEHDRAAYRGRTTAGH